jgi:ribose 5-phosphate isomerase RpiB
MKVNDARILCLGGRAVGTELANVLVEHRLGDEQIRRGESTRKGGEDREARRGAVEHVSPVATRS